MATTDTTTDQLLEALRMAWTAAKEADDEEAMEVLGALGRSVKLRAKQSPVGSEPPARPHGRLDVALDLAPVEIPSV